MAAFVAFLADERITCPRRTSCSSTATRARFGQTWKHPVTLTR